jgi:hypothetical protein
MIANRFEIRGVHLHRPPQEQLETARVNAERFHLVGDEIVVVVDAFSNPPQNTDPATMTVQEHISASEQKIADHVRGKDLEELIEIGSFIGPFVTAVATGVSTQCDEFVRLGLYRPRIRY